MAYQHGAFKVDDARADSNAGNRRERVDKAPAPSASERCQNFVPAAGDVATDGYKLVSL